jgi:hypothetical protein
MLAGLCLGVILDLTIQSIMRLVGPKPADHDANFMIAAEGAGTRRG